VITAYQPGKGHPSLGNSTVITQQYSLLMAEKRENPSNVCKHFIDDLAKFLRKCSKNEEDVMLAGDFNDILGKESRVISKICKQFELVDAIHYYHGQAPDRFATWIDGCEILDYVLVSRALLPFINACGYEPFMANVPGDHRGMHVDFNTHTTQRLII
jgi:endonuclease/exonuclease/phosphatase family metal-dependent hydrolase